MKKKNVLSLHEETEKEAAKIEKEILKDSKLEELSLIHISEPTRP